MKHRPRTILLRTGCSRRAEAAIGCLLCLLLFACSYTAPGRRVVEPARNGTDIVDVPLLPPPGATTRAAPEKADAAYVRQIIRRRRDQARARALMREGDDLCDRKKWSEALQKYRQAERLLLAITTHATETTTPTPEVEQ